MLRDGMDIYIPHSAQRRKRIGRARTGGDTNIGNRTVLMDVEMWCGLAWEGSVRDLVRSGDFTENGSQSTSRVDKLDQVRGCEGD
jgi:hypothetical protein